MSYSRPEAAAQIPACGTESAWARHRRCGKPIDDQCRCARNLACVEHEAGRDRRREAQQ